MVSSRPRGPSGRRRTARRPAICYESFNLRHISRFLRTHGRSRGFLDFSGKDHHPLVAGQPILDENVRTAALQPSFAPTLRPDARIPHEHSRIPHEHQLLQSHEVQPQIGSCVPASEKLRACVCSFSSCVHSFSAGRAALGKSLPCGHRTATLSRMA